MIVPNRVLACHHIELEGGCPWCGIYRYQAVRECDRCHLKINTDAVYIAITDLRPQLICAGCRLWGLNAEGVK